MKTGWLGKETSQTLKLKKKTIVRDEDDEGESLGVKDEPEEILFKESPFQQSLINPC